MASKENYRVMKERMFLTRFECIVAQLFLVYRILRMIPGQNEIINELIVCWKNNYCQANQPRIVLQAFSERSNLFRDALQIKVRSKLQIQNESLRSTRA